jgi:hypothetical protein
MADAAPPPPDPVVYEGSRYHKRYPFQRTAPGFGLLSDKTECPPEIEEDQVLAVLPAAISEAIRESRCSRLRDGQWPRNAWGRTSFPIAGEARLEVVWEAKIVNRSTPSYKAYPVRASRHNQLMPTEVRRLLWPAG